MRKLKDLVSRLSIFGLGALSVASIAAMIFPGEAAAQVRPAMVRSVDEPGRVPYQHSVGLNIFDPVCGGLASAFSCQVSFPAVPAGKRLVLQYVSATQPGLPGFDLGATVRADTSQLRIELAPVGSQVLSNGGKNFIFGQQVHGYVEAGDAPMLIVYAIGNGVDNSFGRIYFISGYLVDVLP